MKLQFLFISLLGMLFLACSQKHRATTDLGDHVFVEYFNINPAGVDEAFLTDSVNFRVYIGKYDSDHEKVGCEINGDTILVFKNKGSQGGARILIEQAKLSKEYLIKNKVQSTEPLFKFS